MKLRECIGIMAVLISVLCIVAKNRHGSVGNVKMGWIGQFTKFRTIEDDYAAN